MKDAIENGTNGSLGAQGLIEEGEAFRKLSGQGPASTAERYDVIVIGAGQAGLSVGHHLSKLGLRFVILDAHARIGDAWRKRWDSLRLFTPNHFNGLDGLPFPGSPDAFPTKDEMADYLETYAAHFRLPVRSSVRVERLCRSGEGYSITAGGRSLEADHVVIAMSNYQGRKVPAFAKDLAPEIVQLHSSEYQNLAQLRPGGVLLVGAGNSGGEIAMETVTRHPTWISGRDPGEVPFRTDGFLARWILLRFLFRVVFHRLLTVKTPIGRKARAKMLRGGNPRIRQKVKDFERVGIQRVAKTVGVKDGLPLLDDGQALKVANIIWCVGFDPALSWVDLPIFDPDGEPRHASGVVEGEAGLYFVGQHFLHSVSSVMIHGVGRDAERIARTIAERCAHRRPLAAMARPRGRQAVA